VDHRGGSCGVHCRMADHQRFRPVSPMAQLILKHASASRPSGEWDDDDFDVLADFLPGLTADVWSRGKPVTKACASAPPTRPRARFLRRGRR
jgi:hypothetical protein